MALNLKVSLPLGKGLQGERNLEAQWSNGPLIPRSSQAPGEEEWRDMWGVPGMCGCPLGQAQQHAFSATGRLTQIPEPMGASVQRPPPASLSCECTPCSPGML